ncbi:uncharacterized protein Dwil_GK23063 [Drosophila willistoni]|uniref:Aquaporin n=1 Tax=Drosophila willistoni TaxID=7260 RepID=B4NMM8_DROWI|nr:lens fiber major intrinsic protein [Drosophila willistoni]EDW85617.2 uncharacterized protein Dwil_GK23063 [Drosophila willistoni]
MILNFYTFMRGFGEFGAMLLYMVLGCMSGKATSHDAGSLLISSLQYGLTGMTVMHIFGFISGAHANPCVSIACWIFGYIPMDMMMLYVSCQLTGALTGYFLLLQMLPQEVIDNSKPAVCLVEPLASLSNLQIVGIECFLTSVLIMGWCALWDVRSGRFLDSVTLRMGFLITACSFAGGTLTGASMNPAKTLVPTIFHGNPETVLLQLGGQILASIVVPHIWQLAYTPRYRLLESVPLNQPCL